MSFYLNRRNKDWLIDWLFEFDTSNTASQHCYYIVSNGWNVVSTFESCAALKSSLRIVTWHHLNGFIFWIINQSLIEFLGVRLTMRRGVSFSFPLRAFRASVLPLSFQRPASQTTRTLPSLTVNLNFRHFDSWQAEYYYGYAILMSPIRAKQLSMTATARVIWLCACVRYWPGRELVYTVYVPLAWVGRKISFDNGVVKTSTSFKIFSLKSTTITIVITKCIISARNIYLSSTN